MRHIISGINYNINYVLFSTYVKKNICTTYGKRGKSAEELKGRSIVV
jgi:hypothetical protein